MHLNSLTLTSQFCLEYMTVYDASDSGLLRKLYNLHLLVIGLNVNLANHKMGFIDPKYPSSHSEHLSNHLQVLHGETSGYHNLYAHF